MNKNLLAGLPQFPVAPVTSKLSYLSRLNRLWERMADNSVCILVSNPEYKRSNDTNFPFRQSSELVYLSGFPEPDSVLILSKLGGKQNLIMLVQEKDREQEIWNGFRYGVGGAKSEFQANEAYPTGKFEQIVGKLLRKAGTVYYRFGVNRKFDKQFRKLWDKKQKTLQNPAALINELRLFKSDEELQLMRHAGLVSAEAHKQAMLACRPGVRENQLQAVIEFVFAAAGATAPAYGTIVAAGNNACTLHYVENSAEIQDGDLVLVDAGCEFGGRAGGYAGDITRSFPANGKFSEPQRQIYELVLKAQLAGIAAARPGVKLAHIHHVCERIMRRGLIELGILPTNASAHNERKQTGKSESLTLGDLYPHGTSHWLGIDVHDVGSYDNAARKSAAAKQRLLEPGMVFTIEPGLYLDKNDKRVPKRYRGIGVRIEDDVVITQDGNEVLTATVPKSVEEIEALMAPNSR